MTIPPPSPKVASPQLASPIPKKKALPQRPGPNGSRVVKKRPSIPRLGEGLLNLFTLDRALIKSPAYPGQSSPEVSSTLTSSDFSHLDKDTQSTEEATLVGTPDQSTPSNPQSLSPVSSRSHTPRDGETSPTTPTGDDSPFSSDKEATPAKDKALSTAGTTPSPTHGWMAPNSLESPTSANKGQLSPIIGPLSRIERDSHGRHSVVPHLADKLSESFETVPIHTGVETVTTDEIIPTADSLHGIVKGFFATETKAESITSSVAEPQRPPTLAPRTPKPSVFWDEKRIVQFFFNEKITAEKAKETAKRHGYLGLIPLLDAVEKDGMDGLKQRVHEEEEHPSLFVDSSPKIEEVKQHGEHTSPDVNVGVIIPRSVEHSDTVVPQHQLDITSHNQMNIGVIISKPMEIFGAIVPQQHQPDITSRNFTLKLSKYSAEDTSSGATKSVHMFVDMSNIHIGFCNSWKISQNIPVYKFVKAPAFSVNVLNTIMQRNRPAKKKILAGSVANAVSGQAQWPRHFIEAQAQGYKMNILNRVQKRSPVKFGRNLKAPSQGTGMPYAADMPTSGDDSTEDQAYETRNGEQGVDEILHLNMMDSVLDCIREPAIMSLATGDAAQAEFSDGFLQYAIRALENGWDMELVTWKKTISSAWMNPTFRSKYGERFRIIYLDDFLQELNGDLCPSLAWGHRVDAAGSVTTN